MPVNDTCDRAVGAFSMTSVYLPAAFPCIFPFPRKIHSGSRKYSYMPQNFLMNILCASYETFWNFVGVVTRPGCRDNNRKIFNRSENVYESYKTFTVNVHFSLIGKVWSESENDELYVLRKMYYMLRYKSVLYIVLCVHCMHYTKHLEFSLTLLLVVYLLRIYRMCQLKEAT